MRGWWWVGCGLLAGCTRGNPEFDAAGATDAATSVADDDGTSAGRTSGDDATTRTEDSATSGTSVSTSGDDLPVDDTGVVDTGPDPVDTGNVVCSDQDPAVVGVQVTSRGGVVTPDCDQPLTTGLGPMLGGLNMLVVDECGGCECPQGPGTTFVELTGDVPVPLAAVPGCGRMIVWAEHDDGGVCRWAGVAVFDEVADVPQWIATDALSVPSLIVGGMTATLAPFEDCTTGTCADQGVKAIDFGSDTISPDEPAKVIELPFGAAIPALVDDFGSSIDGACVEHVAWTARFNP